MAITSLAVWTTTGPRAAPIPVSPRAPSPPKPQAEPPGPDHSTFQAGDTLMMSGRLGHPVIQSAVDTDTFLFVDVKADAGKVAAHAPPLNLSIAIDRSGSMKGKRLENAVSAARTMIGRLHDGDLVSVVAYNTRSDVIVPTTRIDATTRRQAAARLGSLVAMGDTCISCGIETSMRLVGRNPGMVNQILLLSDGEATAGLRDVPSFVALAQDCQRMSASITTIGVDVDYNERIMSALARESNGRHYFVERPDDLPRIFDQEAAALQQTLATDVRLAVDLAPGVIVDQVFDRTVERVGNRITVPLGAFVASDDKTLLLRLRVPRGPDGERPVAGVQLAYNDLALGRNGACSGELAARATTDATQVAQLDGVVSARVNRSQTAAAIEEANELARNGRADDARAVLDHRRRELGHAAGEAAASSPAPMAPAVAADFGAQDEVLGGAGKGFADQPADRSNKSQVKDNETDALMLAK